MTQVSAGANAVFKLLANDIRWSIVHALARGDYRVQDLVGELGEAANLVSYHVGQLRKQQLIHERRSDADGRDTYYQLDIERLHGLYQAAGLALHPHVLGSPALDVAQNHRRVRVLFLCTHNSARSQLAEALARAQGLGRIEAFSAGSAPTQVHPAVERVLASCGVDASGLRSKDVQELAGQHFDYVVTVCDRVREICPSFPGSAQIHWSIADPAGIEDAAEGQDRAFERTLRELNRRIAQFAEGALGRVHWKGNL